MQKQFSPIAIVGLSCLLPGCQTPEELWEVVQQGAVTITTVPENYWRISPEKILAKGSLPSGDQAFCSEGGYIQDFHWDPTPFALAPEYLNKLDAVFQWSLYCAYQAVKDLALFDQAIKKKTGVILGNLSYPTSSHSQLYEQEILNRLFPDNLDKTSALHPDNRFGSGLPAELIAKGLQLGGEALCLDAACASSLYALKLACDQLQSGRADLMLAGGINAADSLFLHVGFTALKALSPTGQSRPFHQEADGLIPGEGAGFLVLKRLAEAEKDGDKIYAVIRGIGLSNDGRDKGFLSPSSQGQVRSMNQAYKKSGISPEEISYVECHATGTRLGDSCELQSLATVFGRKNKIALGSLKANLGHLITASGVAGIIKIIQAFCHNTLPTTPNSQIKNEMLEGTEFFIPPENLVWKRGEKPRMAAVNGFGFGGNNAHVILEEWDPLHYSTQNHRQQAKEKAPQTHTNSKAAPTTSPKVAVIGINLQYGGVNSIETLFEYLHHTDQNKQPGQSIEACRHIQLNAKNLVFPPKDLEETLGQQTLLLQLLEKEGLGLDTLDQNKTGVFIGMEVDSESNRVGLRIRLEELFKQREISFAFKDFKKIKNEIYPPLSAARVVGGMPNILANRLNSQYNWKGQSFSFSTGKNSGIAALNYALDCIFAGELQSAIVGAVDMGDEELHQKVSNGKGANAGVVWVLKEYKKAIEDKNSVIAVLYPHSNSQENTHPTFSEQTIELSALYQNFGHAPLVQDLLEKGVALLTKYYGLTKGSESAYQPQLTVPDRPRPLFISPHYHAETQDKTTLLSPAATLLQSPFQPPQMALFSGNTLKELRKNIEKGKTSRQQPGLPLRLGFHCNDGLEFKKRQDQALELLRQTHPKEGWNDRICFFPHHKSGDVAFVFTGAASAYRGVSQDLLEHYPRLALMLQEIFQGSLASSIGWMYPQWGKDLHHNAPFNELCGSSFICQLHNIISQKIWGLKPNAVLGLSSGETNAMFATGTWQDLPGLFQDIWDSELYQKELAGEYQTVKRFWGLDSASTINWGNWILFTEPRNVEDLVAREERAYLTIISSPKECIIAGDAKACQRIIQKLPGVLHTPLKHDLACHCPVLGDFTPTWEKIHTREVYPQQGIRFYSNYFGGEYTPTQETVAQALTGQAAQTLNLPLLIRKAYKDGVRIFIEHGPRDSLSKAIRQTLSKEELQASLVISLDNFGTPAVEQLHRSTIELWCAGIDINLDAFTLYRPEEQIVLTFPIRTPPVHLSKKPINKDPLPLGHNQAPNSSQLLYKMPCAPELAPPEINEQYPGPKATPSLFSQEIDFLKTDHIPSNNFPDDPSITGIPDLVNHICQQQARIHQDFLQQQLQGFEKYIQVINRQLHSILKKAAIATDIPAPGQNTEVHKPGPHFSREQLEVLASSRISSVFGPEFSGQDHYPIQVRMPEPPLLLCDRVTGIKAIAKSMDLGTIWTETDVLHDSWYIHQGYMPAGIFIEAGQADLLLISYLGVDFLNQGERAYRLLGCELQLHGDLPRAGETLQYKIDVAGHAQTGDLRLFFFHYDCFINGHKRMSIRNGQAGFFSKKELAESSGVLWNAEDASYSSSTIPPSPIRSPRSSFSKKQIEAWQNGDLIHCFGRRYFLTQCHTRTPQSASGKMNFIQEIDQLDTQGGPAGRGYLKSISKITPDDWYFKGHFKNDPCMPGTLMAEGCLQMISFYMIALGYSLDKDGWRFQPIPENKFTFHCRGQVTPESKELIYEIFIDEILLEPQPTIFAHVLCTVDGCKSFLCERLGVQLVPDWPLEQHHVPDIKLNDRLAVDYQGFQLNKASLLSCALGKPTKAFGKNNQIYNQGIRTSRLPGPPYHFMTRIVELNAEFGAPYNQPSITAEYDIPADAWYFKENGDTNTMPYCVLMEIALQPCGWLASFCRDNELHGEELLFRNLDGIEAVQHAEVSRKDGTLVTKVKMLSASRTGALIINQFEVKTYSGETLVYSFRTTFGFFPPESMVSQKGLKISKNEQNLLNLPANFHVDLKTSPKPYFSSWGPSLPGPKLLMLDRVTAYYPSQGGKERGYLRGEKDVNPADWFFKAHFFQDPVQPGSLGIEAVLQLMQFYLLETGKAQIFPQSSFEPVAVGAGIEWHYRGQITPDKSLISIDMEILEEIREASGYLLWAKARVWIDGLKIYELPKVGMRLRARASLFPRTFYKHWQEDDKQSPWIRDHCPTYTVPTLPFTYLVELACQATEANLDNHGIFFSSIQITSWLDLCQNPESPNRSTPFEIKGEIAVTANSRESFSFEVSKKNPPHEQPSFEAPFQVCGSGCCQFLKPDSHPTIPPIPKLLASKEEELPYNRHIFFHGPSFQLLRHVAMGSNGARAQISAQSQGIPHGKSGFGILDGALQAIPHENMQRWIPHLDKDLVAYPCKMEDLTLLRTLPQQGELTVETRFLQLRQEKYPVTGVWIVQNEEVVGYFTLIEILVPKGISKGMDPEERYCFFSKKLPFKKSKVLGKSQDGWALNFTDIQQSDWLPGTLENIYALPKGLNLSQKTQAILVKEYIAQQQHCHPGRAQLNNQLIFNHDYLQQNFEIQLIQEDSAWIIKPVKPRFESVDCQLHALLEARGFANDPLVDLISALAQRFIGQTFFEDYEQFMNLGPCIYLANHQVAIESLLFATLVYALKGHTVATVSKAQNEDHWLGQIQKNATKLYGDKNPLDIFYFNRENPEQFVQIFRDFLNKSFEKETSLFIHAGGTREQYEGEGLQNMSTFIIDNAVNAGIAIVPIRFSGALPFTDSGCKFELPDHLQGQTYTFGKALFPKDFENFHSQERTRLFIETLNNLQPSSERPPLDKEFKKAVKEWQKSLAISEFSAVCLQVLQEKEDLSPQTLKVLNQLVKGEKPIDGFSPFNFF